MLDRTGAILIDDAQQRILYPVITTSAFKAFLENFVGRRANQPSDVHTAWFLFQGEAPLTISVFGSQQAAVNVPVEFVRPRQFDRRIKQWWQAFNRVVDEQVKSGDYPPILQAYLKDLIGKRFGYAIGDQRKKKTDPLTQTFQLMFDVESLRIKTINRSNDARRANTTCRPTAASLQSIGHPSRSTICRSQSEDRTDSTMCARRVFLSTIWYLGKSNLAQTTDGRVRW